jgi:hypothetical protein
MGMRMNRHIKATLWGAAFIGLAGIFVMLAAARQSDITEQPRSDIIVIDTLKAFGPLERPPVTFLHDQHTTTLAKEKKDCLACHPMNPEKKRLSIQFQRTGEDTDKQQVMDIYHNQCISCHKQNRAQQKDAGPVTCGECHVEDAQVPSNWQPIGMDHSLHYRHVKASDNKCERCHHQYNAETKTLFYEKGQESSCVYCHKDQTEDNRISIRLAAHTSCVACHRQQRSEGKNAGPLECAGCHSPQQQALIEKVADPPRIERNQPDITLVKTHAGNLPDPAAPLQARMARTPFAHKPHEGYSDNCRTCHHASLAACADCHTLAGHVDGKNVKLAQAMHQPDAPMSCVGCHNAEQARPACAGCHASIPQARVWSAQTSCKVCHVPYAGEQYPQEPEAVERLAAELAATRSQAQTLPGVQDIPEIVPIGHLVEQFEAVQMPHRKIVLKLAELTRDHRLANAFHVQPTTLCQGCHHNSPPSLKPPQCGACHGRTSDALNPNRPGLMAAFHEQCFRCHDQMGIEKPDNRDCAGCHAKRASSEN